MRNVRRGRGRTFLLIVGLLVATMIVAGSLVVGNTVQNLAYHYTYLGAGYLDEAVTGTAATGNGGYFPYTAYTQTDALLAGDHSIVGVAPEIVTTAAVYDRTNGIPDTDLNLIGVNGNQSAALGTFLAENGTSIAGPVAGGVLLDEQTAKALNASTGDTVEVFGVHAVTLTVQAIVQENVRGAFITAGLTAGNVFVTLSSAQQIENASGFINYIAITNAGSDTAGAAASTSVSASLNVTLATVLAANRLQVTTPLETALEAAATSSQSLTTLFLVLGLFSILAGATLIIGIFVMLAEERKGEMGMLRAIGMRQGELVYTYYFEGVAYAAGSALAGTFCGVAVGFVLVTLSGPLLAADGIPAKAIVQSFSVSEQDLVIAYVVGFLLTLVTVIVACRRASRLNIVRAIRNIPEPRPPMRAYTLLAVFGGAVAALGLLGFLDTYRGTTDLAYPLIAGAFVILGVGLVAARFVPNRAAFTGIGVGLAIWGGTDPLHNYLLGTAHSGTLFNLFVVGIILVGGAVLIVLLNADLIVAFLRAISGSRVQDSPVVRVGLNYPTRQSSRTAVSLTIFALVVFTLIATAGAGSTLQGSLNATVASESGGYTFFGYSDIPLPDLWSDISTNSTLSPLFTTAVPIVLGGVNVNVTGYSANPYADSLYAAPANATGAGSFYATNHFPFESTVNGMNASAAFQAIETDPSDAIVDESYANLANSLSVSTSPHPKVNVGDSILLASPNGAHSTTVTVIGILKESILSGVWVNPSTAAALGYRNETGYLLTVAPGVSAADAARDAKQAFFPAGLVLFDLRGLLATSISSTEALIGLLEVFVGLGLAVGIAAMGIFALRAVAERRREIGMLRALGFTQSMVLRALILEYSFVTLLGVAIGTGLGVLLIYNVSISASAVAEGLQTFVAPWAAIVEVAILAYLLVLVAIAAPSLRAAHAPPAEAVRPTE